VGGRAAAHSAGRNPFLENRSMQFFKAIAAIPDPLYPSNDIDGEIPARALKFCEPFLAANRAGYLLCPPVDFVLSWTGAEILAEIGDVGETVLLERAFLPDFAEEWSAIAQPEALEVMPPFLEAFPERGVVQVWTGYFVRTDPDISSWVRGRVNRTGSSAYSVIEGLVETDWWTGPLFFVLQINKTDFPVRFRRSEPFVQVIPFQRPARATQAGAIHATRMADAPADLWAAIRKTAERRNGEPPGSYRRVCRHGGRVTSPA
jgi:hypothetical protein